MDTGFLAGKRRPPCSPGAQLARPQRLAQVQLGSSRTAIASDAGQQSPLAFPLPVMEPAGTQSHLQSARARSGLDNDACPAELGSSGVGARSAASSPAQPAGLKQRQQAQHAGSGLVPEQQGEVQGRPSAAGAVKPVLKRLRKYASRPAAAWPPMLPALWHLTELAFISCHAVGSGHCQGSPAGAWKQSDMCSDEQSRAVPWKCSGMQGQPRCGTAASQAPHARATTGVCTRRWPVSSQPCRGLGHQRQPAAIGQWLRWLCR